MPEEIGDDGDGRKTELEELRERVSELEREKGQLMVTLRNLNSISVCFTDAGEVLVVTANNVETMRKAKAAKRAIQQLAGWADQVYTQITERKLAAVDVEEGEGGGDEESEAGGVDQAGLADNRSTEERDV